MKRTLALIASFALFSSIAAHGQAAPDRWSEEKANAWYAQQPWLVGADFIPSDAINELEMFQAATFNPSLNDKELGLAESIGMNTMRVFLQDQLWQQDPEGFKKRLDTFLTIAAKHHIKPLLVLFDSCWETNPHLGPQHPPIPGIHNSGWVQSPGKKELLDVAYEPKLQAYVVGIVGAFANDKRILGWDIWNEPDNGGGDLVADVPAKVQRMNELLPKAFAWARSAHASQPLTSGVWTGNWSDPAKESTTTKIQLAESDVISFHNYGWPEEFEAKSSNFRRSTGQSSAPSTWRAAQAAPLTAPYPLQKNTTSEPSTGASSPARRKPTFPGIPGKIPTSDASQLFGSMRSSVRTTHPTANMKST
jgi:Cellulase (glycosyl hydrolase family 5)